MWAVDCSNLEIREVEPFTEHIHADNSIKLKCLELADYPFHVCKRVRTLNERKSEARVLVVRAFQFFGACNGVTPHHYKLLKTSCLALSQFGLSRESNSDINGSGVSKLDWQERNVAEYTVVRS